MRDSAQVHWDVPQQAMREPLTLSIRVIAHTRVLPKFNVRRDRPQVSAKGRGRLSRLLFKWKNGESFATKKREEFVFMPLIFRTLSIIP